MDFFKYKKIALVVPLAVGCGLIHYMNQKAEVLSPSTFAQSTTSAKNSPSAKKAAAGRNLSPLERDIAHEASQLYDNFENPEQVEGRIKAKAQKLGAGDIQALTQMALNNNGNKDERTVAAYYLKLAGAKAQDGLIAVFVAPCPSISKKAATDDEENMNQQFEYGLRTMALEGIEENIHQAHLTLPAEVVTKQGNVYLSGLLKIVLAGEQAQRPLLKEFINKSLEQVVSL